MNMHHPVLLRPRPYGLPVIKRLQPCVVMKVSDKAASLAQQWLKLDTDDSTRQEVQAWIDQGQETIILDRLGKRLEFGTAGLRGRMGAGYHAMNRIVVQQTSQGLCRYLQQQAPELLKRNGIVIGYDGRYHSREFAEVIARVFLSQGVPVHLFADLVPTPFVAAGVVELSAAAGVMVTASHNPKDDNGYKVYWGNGCQIIPPHDEGIAHAIEAHLDLWPLPALPPQPHPLLSDPSQQVMSAYYQRLVENLSFGSPDVNAAAQPVTYTPLHGVGAKPLLKAFQACGLPAPHVVPAQAEPDPEFSTVVFPNPEEGAGTWSLAFAEGRARGSRLVIANDPDADRLAAAEADPDAPGGYHAFTGNEIGALLAHWVWTRGPHVKEKVPAGKCVMLASAVSSAFLGAMARKEGFKFEQTLTGFKWLGNRALELQAQGKMVLFAFEEALGSFCGGMYPDKDGIAGAAVLAELAAHLYSQGTTLRQHLALLYTTYGSSAYRSGYFISDQPAKTARIFDQLRKDGQDHKEIGGAQVEWVRDLGVGLDTSQPGGKATLPWRAGDMMITYGLKGGAVLTLRASGTEPKLKYYLEVLDEDVQRANQLADALVTAVDVDVLRVDQAGLLRPKPA